MSTWFGVMNLLFPIVMATGLSGVPMAMPPLAEDPLLVKLAPEECLWYFSSAGVDAAHADSKNATERLLAEPELQTLYKNFETQILAMFRARAAMNQHEDEAVMAEDAAKLLRIMVTRPLVMYLGKIALEGETGPHGEAGIIANLGDDSAEIETTLLRLEKIVAGDAELSTYEEGGITWRQLSFPAPAPPVAWGIRGRYLLIGIGEKVGPAIMARARNTALPRWLTDVKKRLPVERVSVVSYLNVAGIRELAAPFLLAPQVGSFVKSFGADQAQSIMSVSGLDAKGCVSRTLVQFEPSKDQSAGILSLVSEQPLQAADLQHIPADASLAAALRIDSSHVWNWVTELIAQVEPRADAQLGEVYAAIKEVTGADLQTEILPALGDVWSIHASPADGGFPWTGAVLSVSVKDHAVLSRVNNSVVGLLRQLLPDPPPDTRRNYASLRTVQSGDETIYFLNIVENSVPFAPAWCVTKERLMFALYPQSIKGALALPPSEKRLSDVPEVAAHFRTSTAPTGISYVDTRSVFRTLYPALQIGLQVAAAEWQREGIQLDVSVLPPARTIERHLQPTLMTFNRVSDGLEFTRTQTMPGISLTGAAPLLAGLATPAILAARAAAQSTKDMNTLKMLMLAMHSYHNSYNRLPPPQWGTNGNKGLSWRVAILQFLDEPALYNQFHHDEPWNSEHNIKLIEKMPEFYRSAVPTPRRGVAMNGEKKIPAGELKYEAYRTPFVTLRHPDSIFPPPGDRAEFAKGLGLKAITDGTSKTVAIVLASPEKAVIWTKPDDLDFDPEEPFAGIVGPGGLILAAFCDGHVQRFAQAVGEQTMKALMTRGGGEPVQLD